MRKLLTEPQCNIDARFIFSLVKTLLNFCFDVAERKKNS